MWTLPDGGLRPPPGSFADPPATLADRGAVAYDVDPRTKTYVLYGTGKKLRDAITVAQVSNRQPR